jgi:hypothetical protein
MCLTSWFLHFVLQKLKTSFLSFDLLASGRQLREIPSKYELSPLFPRACSGYFYCISIVFLIYFHRISIVFPTYFHCISMVFQLKKQSPVSTGLFLYFFAM